MCFVSEHLVAIIYDMCKTVEIVDISSFNVHSKIEGCHVLCSLSAREDCIWVGTDDGQVIEYSCSDSAMVRSTSLPSVEQSVELSSLFKSKYRKNLGEHERDDDDD